MEQVDFQSFEIDALREQLKIREADIAFLRQIVYDCFTDDGHAVPITDETRHKIAEVVRYVENNK